MTAPSPTSAEDISIHIALDTGWEMLSAAASSSPESLDESAFGPACVPGTVASSLRESGAWRMGAGVNFDASDHWFRCRFESVPAESREEIVLRFGGIATLAEVWLNGEQILTTDSMFASHQLNVTPLVEYRNELLIVCRSLTAALRDRRRRQPVARWRTRVVAEQQLRWYRTTLLGRAPGFAREPQPVGPWRPVTLERRRRIVLEEWTREASLAGTSAVVNAHLRIRKLDNNLNVVSGRLIVGEATAVFNVSTLEIEGSGEHYEARASVAIHDVLPWMPHTHGDPHLYPVRAELEWSDGSVAIFEDVPVGFRCIDAGVDHPGDDGLALKINGTPVFCRGVVWMPPDAASLAASASVVRERLQLLRDAGFNLVRVAGTTFYQDETFHRLCDELGLLVWQDMMFANMDYPYEDSDFRDAVHAEAKTELSRLAKHASLAVICGNSEIEQQAGMLGLPPETGRGPWFGRDLPALARDCCPGIPYVPSAPCGGDMPFRTRHGIANYFGVGAYLRSLEDVRRSEVKFASECLAFANVPEPEAIEKLALATPGGISPAHPVWKRGVPRDSGASWDFEDVRDHYLKLLYSVDPAVLRSTDCNCYWELSRMVSGEAMSEVFGEWRRPQSPCSGGIILWAADLEPGAGWGILDSDGRPKSAYWFLKRTLSPRSVWTTDEGLNGIDIHVANDLLATMDCRLRVGLYRNGEQCVGQNEIEVSVPKHQALTFGFEQILGRFVDAGYSYRFGPPNQEVIVCSLLDNSGDVPFAQCFRYPAGRSITRVAMSELGMTGKAQTLSNERIEVMLTSRRVVRGVRVAAPGFLPDDAYFDIEPGGRRRIKMNRCAHGDLPVNQPVNLWVSAVNAMDRITVPIGRRA